MAHLLAGHRGDHVRAGQVHLRGVAHHEHEVGQRGGVGRAARARAEDHADLRDDPGRRHVPAEDPAVPVEREHALLDARAAAVVQPDERGARGQREVHDFVDLLRVRRAERAAEDREILRVDEDLPTLDHARPGDHAVGVWPLRTREPTGLAPPVGVELDEGTVVQQQLQPRAGGQLAQRGLAARGIRPLAGDLGAQPGQPVTQPAHRLGRLHRQIRHGGEPRGRRIEEPRGLTHDAATSRASRARPAARVETWPVRCSHATVSANVATSGRAGGAAASGCTRVAHAHV